jgi:hypothetical protein
MASDSPPLAPVASQTVYFVLDDLGSRYGRVYRETPENGTDEATIVANILDGQYKRPLQVIAFNLGQGRVSDVTADVAMAVLKRAQLEHRLMGETARAFVALALGPDVLA